MTENIDKGPEPVVMNIGQVTLANENYRTTLWTGENLQLTVMAIQPGHEIGLEAHDDHDQFLRIEEGEATVYMGASQDNLNTWPAKDDDAIFVPAGTWHNLVNTGQMPLKLYLIYAPAEDKNCKVDVT